MQPVPLAPVHQVVGGGRPDTANLSIEIPDKTAVFPDTRIPEREVLSVEGMAGHDRFRAVHRRPVDAIRRLECIQSARIPPETNRLVFLARFHPGVRVLENREVMRFLAVDLGQHDVVLFRTVVFEQSQVGFHPANPILALGISNPQRMRLVAIRGDVPGVIVHPVPTGLAEALVIKHRVVVAPVPLPGRIVDQ